jgi:putative tricarboxylic transport membrane protein
LRLQPTWLAYAVLGCVVRHHRRHAARSRAAGRHQPAAAADLRPDADHAIVLLAGIYYGAMYGGSTTSILMRIPGEAASVMTCIDGYAMTRRAAPARRSPSPPSARSSPAR